MQRCSSSPPDLFLQLPSSPPLFLNLETIKKKKQLFKDEEVLAASFFSSTETCQNTWNMSAQFICYTVTPPSLLLSTPPLLNSFTSAEIGMGSVLTSPRPLEMCALDLSLNSWRAASTWEEPMAPPQEACHVQLLPAEKSAHSVVSLSLGWQIRKSSGIVTSRTQA